MLAILARHGNSQLNVEHRINGDPSIPVLLTEEGKAKAHELGVQLANIPIGLCLHTRFGRTQETAALALAGRGVRFEVEPLLDDLYVGELEGVTVDEFRAWKADHRRADPFPGGESLVAAARRYVQGFRKLLDRSERCVLVVCHEIPIRYALNGAVGSDELDGPAHTIPNATPYLLDGASLARAVDRMEELALADADEQPLDDLVPGA
jgi:broad specificity phosphatase PhoE